MHFTLYPCRTATGQTASRPNTLMVQCRCFMTPCMNVNLNVYVILTTHFIDHFHESSLNMDIQEILRISTLCVNLKVLYIFTASPGRQEELSQTTCHWHILTRSYNQQLRSHQREKMRLRCISTWHIRHTCIVFNS